MQLKLQPGSYVEELESTFTKTLTFKLFLQYKNPFIFGLPIIISNTKNI